MSQDKKRQLPLALIIMDGLAYGANENASFGNAVIAAKTPNLDAFRTEYPFSQLEASGLAVGLPEGQMGNSEVGHLNIGAGRTVYQELTRIDLAISTGEFFTNEALLKACDSARDKALHLMGLVSDGGVHSSNEHIYALLKLAKERGVDKVYVHAFLDGRDTPPTSGLGYLRELQAKMDELGVGKIASLMGRYYAMDRDKRYDRIERAYDALTLGEGTQSEDVLEALQESYDSGVNDEFVLPIIAGPHTINEGDSLIFFNFRPDRARQLSYAFANDDFDAFNRKVRPRTNFVTLTEYDPELKVEVAYPKALITDVLADVLAGNNLRQLHAAETEKYAHVTFFFNGGTEELKNFEERILIDSPKVATYDQKPEMSAKELGNRLVKEIEADRADVYIVNFANGDMVGHTGVMEAAVRAVETVDEQVGRVAQAILERGGAVLITADHGNAEQMLSECGSESFTAHTCNPVPFMLLGTHAKQVKPGTLCDIAPTILGLLDIPSPDSWDGRDLVVY